MHCVALLGLVAAALAQPFSETLTFTGNVESDFLTPGGELRRGVVLLPDANFGPQDIPIDSPDVGLPPGPQWAGRLSGWDIQNILFQLDFNTGALHIGINCFGVCGDADGDG